MKLPEDIAFWVTNASLIAVTAGICLYVRIMAHKDRTAAKAEREMRELPKKMRQNFIDIGILGLIECYTQVR